MGASQSGLPRAVSLALEDRLRRAPVVVLTGARQTGKTTLLRSRDHDPDRELITLDSLVDLDRARHAPDALFRPGQTYAIDEVQRAPELLLAVKRAVDEHRRPGTFILTGSSNLLLMKGVSETLAGRTANLTMRPMTSRELRRAEGSGPWAAIAGAADAAAALSALGSALPWDWRAAAVRGGLPPAALAASDDDRISWFESYVDTYVQRDLRDLAQIGDLPAFARLVRLAALRTGGLINYADLASDSGLPRTTVQRWLSLLEVSYLSTVLPPFVASRSKRLIKTAKLYGLDSGLGLHLCGVDSASALRELTEGAWLEQLVLNDLLAWRDLEIRKPGLYFYRAAAGAEIDFVLESGRRLLPIEVKSSRSARTDDARAIDDFCQEFGSRAPFGLLLYDGSDAFRLSEKTIAAPLGAIL